MEPIALRDCFEGSAIRTISIVHRIGDDQWRFAWVTVLLMLFSLALKVAAQEPRPADVPVETFPDIGFSVLLFTMLALFLIACFLALLLGIFAALILAGVITGGII